VAKFVAEYQGDDQTGLHEARQAESIAQVCDATRIVTASV